MKACEDVMNAWTLQDLVKINRKKIRKDQLVN